MILFLLIVAGLLFFPPQVWATPISLTDGLYTDTNGTPADDVTAPSDEGDGTIQTWLKAEIKDYNTDNATSLDTSGVGSTPNVKVTTGSGPDSITLHQSDYQGYDYIVLHWGGNGHVEQAFDIVGQTGDLTFNTPDGNGLSFYSLYDPTGVPEPATLLLLGTGLVGLAAIRKGFRRNLAGR
jgi:hypothetical protein